MKKLILFITTALLLNSCGMMVSGTKQNVTFESNADNASVYANYDKIGTTNVEFKLKRSDITKMYTIKADGCRDTSFVLPVRMNPYVYLDVLLFPVMMTDYAFDVHIRTDDVIKIDLDCGDGIIYE